MVRPVASTWHHSRQGACHRLIRRVCAAPQDRRIEPNGRLSALFERQLDTLDHKVMDPASMRLAESFFDPAPAFRSFA
jgi:hypothetical protein